MPIKMSTSKAVDVAQIIIFGLTAIGGIVIGLLDSIGIAFNNVNSATTLILILLGLMSLNLSLERLAIIRRLDRIEDRDATASLAVLPIAVRAHVVSCVHFCADIYRLRRELKGEETAFTTIVDSSLEEQRILLENLAKGRLNLAYEEAGFAQRTLASLFRNRFEAISETDLDFWKGNTPLAQEYLSANLRAINTYRTTVNRIFIITVADLVRRGDVIASILERQHRGGIGWGVAIHEELDPDVAHSPLPLDISLFNGDKAVSTFRKRDDRRFEAILATPGNKVLLLEHQRLYAKVIGECWMVNGNFKNSFGESLSSSLLQEVISKLEYHNNKLKQATGVELGAADPFVVEVSEVEEIPGKIKIFSDILIAWRRERGFDVPDV